MLWGAERSSSAFDYHTRLSMDEDPSPNKNDSSTASNGYSSDQQSEADEPTYNVEHLATFSVGRAHNILDPSDGLDKLWQMEKRTGIWTQKMQIRLNRHELVIVDYENGDVVERFPMHLISSPMAYTGEDPKEPYNNILIFVVKEDPQRKNPMNPSEMHIFQCVQVAAQVVVEDLKLFMSGKLKSAFPNGKSQTQLHLASSAPSPLPPPPNAPAPHPPSPLQTTVPNGINVRQQVSRFNASNNTGIEMLSPSYVAKHQERMELRSAYNGHQSHGDSLDETSSTSSEKYEKEVGILNHCFDDIEQFIAWLQSAAAAYRELERRRKTRKNKKSKDHGDGMLSMRAKPPPERDFVDVFQKFKLSFNLLAKLKAHIHDPNAPELVHFLFTPLALIVDASRDSNYGPNLASKVVSPLLTREAVELLANCLTSKESDLWNSLGDSWIVSRDRWKGYVVPYHPSFRDGYSPEYPFNEDRERAEMAASAAASVARARQDEVGRGGYDGGSDGVNHAGGYYYNGGSGGDHHFIDPMTVEGERRGGDRRQSPDERNLSPDGQHVSLAAAYNVGRSGGGGGLDMQSDISADSIERHSAGPSLFASASMGGGDLHRHFERHQRQWLDDLRLAEAKIVQVIFPRTANNDKELSVFRGEFLEVLDDSRKWWKARNIRGQVAHVPHTIVTHLDDHDAIFNNPLYSRGKDTMAYHGQESPNRSTDGSVSGNEPRLSSPKLHMGPPMPPSVPADLIRKERQVVEVGSSSSTSDNNVEVEERNVIGRTETKKKTSGDRRSIKGDAMTTPDNVSLQEELKRTLGRSKASKDRLLSGLVKSKPRMAPICITELSTAEDVRVWLRSKGFDNRIQDIFEGLDGEMMFLLSRDRLEKSCGAEQGARLDSQLKVQKSLSGFKTLSGRELVHILEARRQRSENEDLHSSRSDDEDDQ